MVFSPGICRQFLVAPQLYDLSVVKNGNFIAEPAGGQAVADVDGGPVSHDIIEF